MEKDTEHCRLQNETPSRLLPVDEWERFDGTPRPGMFFTFDLSTTRRKLLESGRLAKITLKSGTELASLQYRCINAKDGSSGMCHIRELPPEKADIESWLANLPRSVEWCGEGIPALTQKCLLELLKAERRAPSKEEQTRILELQDGKCNTCGGIFDGDLEWDHIARLQQTVKGKKQLFQAICASCHLEKTTNEGSQTKLLESRFSKRAWDAYVQTPRPPALVWNAHSYSSDDDAKLLEIDVRRCRFNAMSNSAHEWSVFCVFDNVVKARPGA
ncbi:MAG: hypothetical protein GY822_09050, partial [Deltaproteobacteria bacterium]|nr:hypothetical protein [Deltaproteobacteria bacterium]